MTGTLPPPGWYPDPSNPEQLRWWTGERWTGAARPVQPARTEPVWTEPVRTGPSGPGADDGPATPVAHEHPPAAAAGRDGPGSTAAIASIEAETDPGPSTSVDDGRTGVAAWPRERRIAAAAIGGLLMVSLVVWGAAVAIQGGDEAPSADGDGVTADGEGATAEGEEDGQGGPVEGEEDGQGAGSNAGSEGETAEGDGGQAEGDATARTVDFDGACSVEVPAERVEDETPLRPWEFEECDYAPVDLESGDRWIVVVASIDGAVSEEEALERSDDHGDEYDLLWSSHYPSLNPGWWVVFGGPFADEDDAADAAEDIGGGAYPRVVSDDDSDRYCIADEGC